MVQDVAEFIRKAENDYVAGQTQLSKYVQVSMYETLNKIDAYANSKHISGETDSQGREKPFFNIVTAAINIWFRATDLDRKNVKVKPTRSNQDIAAFLATCHLQDWMTRENFGKFLNKWGRSLAKYGSSVVKFVEKDSQLHPLVINWSRLIVDTIDFDANPVIEILELTPAQLQQREGYDQEMVQQLIEARTARQEMDKRKKDTKNNYIRIYEIHGNLPLSFLTGLEKDKYTYTQQMHVVSFLARKDKGEFDDFTLYKGKEARSPYMITHLLEEEDQTLAIGAVQNLFEAQWMVNHSVKSIKDQLDVASKLIFQTSDGNFVGQNALSSIEQGDILIHAVNQPLTQVANNSHDITSNQSFAAQWQSLGNQINGISEAMLGQNQPAGSAWRQTEALLQESHSLFEVMTENKGLYLEAMLREFIIPYIKKQMDTSEEIAVTLNNYNLDKIDSLYIPNEAIRRYNQQATDQVLNGQIPAPFNPEQAQAQVQQEVQQQGNTRYFKPSDIPDKTWKDFFKDLEWELEVDITGEQRDTQAVMETLNTALKIVASTPPERLQDPNFKLLFNKILEQSAVVSPIEIANIPPAPPQQQQNKVSESISFKDLPPDGQQQMAAQAGIKIQPINPVQQPVLQGQPNA